MIALLLVAVAMTALLLAFISSGKYGVLSRRQATALMVARTLTAQMTRAAWGDVRFANNNLGNDTTFADPNGVFANAALPSGADTPDTALGPVLVGNESYDTFINVSPQNDADTTGNTVLDGMQFAIIVRYKVGDKYMRAVAIGYRYNPANMSVAQLPL
jgi:Tfp pilus assembly protein PilV